MKAGSIAVIASAMLVASVSLATAQKPPPIPPPRPAAPPPAPAALSVPDPLAGFRPGLRDLYQSPDGSDRFQHLSRYPAVPPVVFPPVYVPPYYYPGPFYYAQGTPTFESMADVYRMTMAETYLQRQREAAQGSLVLEALPDSAEVFVDGYYAGLAVEFGMSGRAINLDAGAHRIEVRTPGSETRAFSVMIAPNDIVRYRGDMQQMPATKPPVGAVAPQRPAVARNFYVIPNCYAGDKPPTGTLPKGCDRKNLQTRK